MPSQVDEEAHQLSYLQKHLGNMLALLADPTEGDGDESLVCNVATFSVFNEVMHIKIFFSSLFVCFFSEMYVFHYLIIIIMIRIDILIIKIIVVRVYYYHEKRKHTLFPSFFLKALFHFMKYLLKFVKYLLVCCYL